MIFPRIREAKRIVVAAVNGISTPEYQTTMRVRTPQRDADGAASANNSRDALVRIASIAMDDDSPIGFDYANCRFEIACSLSISDDDELDLDDHALIAAADIYRAVMNIEREGTPIKNYTLETIDAIDDDGAFGVIVTFNVVVAQATDNPYEAQ
jgi:hypothetical protein